MIKAVLFDFDGTLINTNKLIYKSYNFAFNKVFGREITNEEFLKLYGRPLRKSLIEDYGDDGYSLIDEYRAYNEENHDILVEGFENTTEGLILLRDNNFKLGIVTSKRYGMVMRGIDFLKYNEYFETLVTLDDTERHKPFPDPILKGCEKLCVNPSETVYVGDSVFDLISGRAAGTKTCAVEYSLTSKEELLKHNPDYFFSSVLEFSKEIIKENKFE